MNSNEEDISGLIPNVLDKNWEIKKFDPERIYNVLLRETDIIKEDAKLIVKMVVKFLISAKLKMITPPLIRSITNVMMIRLSSDKPYLEKERLKDDRIGIPYDDLKRIMRSSLPIEEKRKMIADLVIKEYHDVEALIEKMGD